MLSRRAAGFFGWLTSFLYSQFSPESCGDFPGRLKRDVALPTGESVQNRLTDPGELRE